MEAGFPELDPFTLGLGFMVNRIIGVARTAVNSSEALPLVYGLGTSMLPFLKPNEELQIEPVPPGQIRRGDIVMARSGSGVCFTHRVVRILSLNGQRAFLTKGDNRLRFDPLVLPDAIVGRAIRAGRRDLRSRWQRWLSEWIAWGSYSQAVLYHRLRFSRLIRFEGLFRALTNPGSWWVESAYWDSLRRSALSKRARRRGIELRPWSPALLRDASEVWNEAFPGHATNAGRLGARVIGSGRFDPSGAVAVFRSGKLAGWGFATLQPEQDPTGGRRVRGVINLLAVTDEGWQGGAGELLLCQMIGWLRRRGASGISMSPVPVPADPVGWEIIPPVAVAAAHGFQFGGLASELAASPRSCSSPRPVSGPEGVHLRVWQPSDGPAVRQMLHRNSSFRLWEMLEGYLARQPDAAGVELAVWGDRPVGFCRWMPDAQLQGYADVDWVWSVAQRNVTRGYFFNLVVDAPLRGRGIGTALLARACQELFKRGCSQVLLWGPRPDFYERVGFSEERRFVVLTR